MSLDLYHSQFFHLMRGFSLSHLVHPSVHPSAHPVDSAFQNMPKSDCLSPPPMLLPTIFLSKRGKTASKVRGRNSHLKRPLKNSHWFNLLSLHNLFEIYLKFNWGRKSLFSTEKLNFPRLGWATTFLISKGVLRVPVCHIQYFTLRAGFLLPPSYKYFLGIVFATHLKR